MSKTHKERARTLYDICIERAIGQRDLAATHTHVLTLTLIYVCIHTSTYRVYMARLGECYSNFQDLIVVSEMFNIILLSLKKNFVRSLNS